MLCCCFLFVCLVVGFGGFFACLFVCLFLFFLLRFLLLFCFVLGFVLFCFFVVCDLNVQFDKVSNPRTSGV